MEDDLKKGVCDTTLAKNTVSCSILLGSKKKSNQKVTFLSKQRCHSFLASGEGGRPNALLPTLKHIMRQSKKMDMKAKP
jgi:hypothetical protein